MISTSCEYFFGLYSNSCISVTNKNWTHVTRIFFIWIIYEYLLFLLKHPVYCTLSDWWIPLFTYVYLQTCWNQYYVKLIKSVIRNHIWSIQAIKFLVIKTCSRWQWRTDFCYSGKPLYCLHITIYCIFLSFSLLLQVLLHILLNLHYNISISLNRYKTKHYIMKWEAKWYCSDSHTKKINLNNLRD